MLTSEEGGGGGTFITCMIAGSRGLPDIVPPTTADTTAQTTTYSNLLLLPKTSIFKLFGQKSTPHSKKTVIKTSSRLNVCIIAMPLQTSA